MLDSLTGVGVEQPHDGPDAGAAAASQVGSVVSVQVIPRPHDGLAGLGKWLQ